VAGLPTGTVTFLFTDLEGSTRLWEEHPEAMKGALARHDEILRAAVEAHRGSVVKTTGDGLHAAFAVADRALAAAVAAQRALVEESWDLPEPLRVRMGVHTGATEERDGDYYGPAVNRAARVSAAAHGGQILVSHVSEELARDTLPPNVALRDLGEHRLRDLARAERVFQLDAPDLPGEFPPPRSVDAYPENLPVQLSSFVGREAEVRAIGDALRDTRLLTLTGVGGVGKTRLAIQVAAELVPHYPDGAWLCELAPATDADALEQIVCATLGITPRAGTTTQGSIMEFLGPKQLMLVLDNCEHLVAEAGALAEQMLRDCPGVRILATSREGLGVEGEHLRVVRSLGLPDRDATPEDLVATDAGRLFLERARAASGDGSFDDTALRAIAEICRRLDGIPLAIELAAARTAAMAPEEIVRRLDERFRLLTGGRRTAVERHHTLRATVDWSYSLLAERERTVFDRLGAFSGSFDTAAAEAVAAGNGLEPWDVIDALTELVHKSMVVREPRSDTTRYTMLETMRHYARERLDETAEADAVRRRHAEHFAVVADALESGLQSAEEVAYRRRLTDELDNLRTAVWWSLDRDDPADRDHGLQVIAHLCLFTSWDRTMGFGVWALSATAYVDDAEPWVRCGVLAAAEEHRTHLRFDEALATARGALSGGIVGRGAGPALALVVIGSTLLHLGRPDEAVEEMISARRTMEDAGATLYHLGIVTVLAAVFAGYGSDPGRAEVLAEEALAIARRGNGPTLLAVPLYASGNAIEWRDPDLALERYEESIALVRQGAQTSAYPSTLAQAARLWHQRGEDDVAIDHALEAIAFTWHRGDLSSIGQGFVMLATIALHHGQAALAATLWGGIVHLVGTHLSTNGDPRFGADDLVKGIEAELGEAEFTAAQRRGAALTSADLVAYAIDEGRRLQATLSPPESSAP